MIYLIPLFLYMEALKKRARQYAEAKFPHRQEFFKQAVEDAYIEGHSKENDELSKMVAALAGNTESQSLTNKALSKRLFDLLIALTTITITKSHIVAVRLAENALKKQSEFISK